MHWKAGKTNRIYHRSLMQTEKSQPEDKWIMPETKFTDRFRLRVGISQSASETDDYFSDLFLNKIVLFP